MCPALIALTPRHDVVHSLAKMSTNFPFPSSPHWLPNTAHTSRRRAFRQSLALPRSRRSLDAPSPRRLSLPSPLARSSPNRVAVAVAIAFIARRTGAHLSERPVLLVVRPRASTPRLDARARPPARATAARARIGVAGVVAVVVRARAREDANDTADIVVVVVVIAMALGGARGRRCDDARAVGEASGRSGRPTV